MWIRSVLRLHAASFFSLFSSASPTTLPPPPPPPGSAAPFSGSNIDPDIFPSFFFPRPYERHFQQFFLPVGQPLFSPFSPSLSLSPFHVRTALSCHPLPPKEVIFLDLACGLRSSVTKEGKEWRTGRIFLQFRYAPCFYALSVRLTLFIPAFYPFRSPFNSPLVVYSPLPSPLSPHSVYFVIFFPPLIFYGFFPARPLFWGRV